MNNYSCINIYLRACNPSQNKPNNIRPHWYSQNNCFINLLQTINWDLVNLTIVHDGDIKNTLVQELQHYPYNIKQIDTFSYKGYSYEQNCGSSKSLCLTSQIIKEDNIPDNELIYILEQDYLHLSGWCEEILDLYNNLDKYAYSDANKHFCSLYTHPDKVLFINPNANNEWGLYKNMECKVIAAQKRYWAYLPSITSSLIMTKYLFDKFYYYLENGYSDNTMTEQFIRDGAFLIAPVERSLATHCQNPWLSFYIDWEKVNNYANSLSRS